MRVVIAGGGLAAARAAARILRDGPETRVTVVGEEARRAYDRPPMSKSLLTQEADPSPVPLHQDAAGDDTATILAGARAVELDLDAHTLTLANGASLEWDRFIVATGSRARQVAGWTAASGVHTLRTWEDCITLRSALRAGRSLVVIGGGVLGCEVAAAGRALGLAVDLVEPVRQLMARVAGPVVGAAFADLHRSQGVGLHLGAGVDGVARHGSTTRVTLTDGTELAADLVVSAVGSVPNHEWLITSGLKLDGGVVCDATATTSHPDVLAAGDVAVFPHPSHPGGLRLEHWTHAADTAALAGSNVLLEPHARAGRSQAPYFWSEQYGFKLQCLGVPMPDDEVHVVLGDIAERRFLALHVREDRVEAASGIGFAGPLNRLRAAVTVQAPWRELAVTRPWA